MKKIGLFSLTLTLLSGTSAQAQAQQTYVQLILDASGSMTSKLPEGQTRMDAAKSVLTSFLNGVQPAAGLNVGLRVYGSGQSGSTNQCTDSKLFTPMQGFQKAEMQARVNAAKPTGATPIVYSLLEAAKDFPADNSRKLIVLVTDGAESCGGKFSDVLAAFKQRGIEVDVRIIGLDLNDAAKKSFSGFGTFENVKSGAELGQALGRATAPAQGGNYSVNGPKTAVAGSVISVGWKGPSNPGDYVTIVKKGEQLGVYNKWFYTKDGNPGQLQTPSEPGEYELRYSSEKASPNPTLASAPITLTASTYGLQLPAKLGTADEIQVQWKGPNNPGDYVTVVEKGAQDGTYWHYFYTKNGNPGKLRLPTVAGEYEVRYATENTSRNANKATLYTLPITVVANTYRITAPASAKPGSTINISYSGPKNNQDYITIVPTGSPDGAYKDYFYTKDNGKSLKVPAEAGEYEIRWVNEGGKPKETLHSIRISVR